mgnify:CR=1 FL=1
MGMPGCNTLERGVETAIVPAGPALAKFIGNCYGVNLFRYWHNPFFCGGVKKGLLPVLCGETESRLLSAYQFSH